MLTLLAPGTLLITLGMFGLTWTTKLIWKSAQYIIVVLLAGIALGPTIVGRFMDVNSFLFPHGTSGVSTMAGIATVVMGLLAGTHIRHSLSHNNAAHHLNGNKGATGSLEMRRAVYSGPPIIVTSVVTIALQVALALFNTSLLNIFLHSTTPHFWETAGALAVIQPVIALPVLTAALVGINKVHKKVGRLTLQMSLNSEAYLWPALIALLAFTGGNAHGSGHEAMSPATLILMTVIYLCIMLLPLNLGWAWLDRKSGLISKIALLPVLLASVFVTEELGLHTLLGAVVCGIILPHSVSHSLLKLEKGIQYTLVPFFLFNVGLSTSFEVTNINVLIPAILLTVSTAIVQVNTVSYIAVKYLHFWPNKAKAAGWLTTMRGMVEIVVAKSIVDAGIISPELGQAVILMAIIQTLIGPIMAEHHFRSATANMTMPKAGLAGD